MNYLFRPIIEMCKEIDDKNFYFWLKKNTDKFEHEFIEKEITKKAYITKKQNISRKSGVKKQTVLCMSENEFKELYRTYLKYYKR